MTDEQMDSLVSKLDKVILDYQDCAPHNVAAVLLSRVTLLMTMDPSTGKGLVKYVWEKLDEIEQADPSNFL
jgi:hypothetical protein